ncbi:hypothetical protein GC176_06095 [bacterium]|nr:hypothetical protein [bacterium]
MSLLRTVLLTAVIIAARPANSRAEEADSGTVTFYAMGDVPYAPEEDRLLPEQIAAIAADAEFVIHVGDIKRGAPPCDEAVYRKVAGMLRKSVAPVFIIPGDNEWNDCTSPDDAWKFWTQHFMRFDEQWNHTFKVARQPERNENFAFVRRQVLFIGLNIVGGRVHDAAEWKTRLTADLDWVKQTLSRHGADVTSLVIFGHANPAMTHTAFFEPLNDVARSFQKPILYLHGDGHKWILDRPFAARNILRVQVDQGGIAPPVKVTVRNSGNQPFVFDRRNGKAAE